MSRPPALGQRVRVVRGPYAGHNAVVVRRLFRRDPESWCELGPTPEGVEEPRFPFPADDPRGRHVLVAWADMEPR